jgi:hypothetical protein
MAAIDLFHGRGRHCVAWQNPRNPHMRIQLMVHEGVMEMNGEHPQ